MQHKPGGLNLRVLCLPSKSVYIWKGIYQFLKHLKAENPHRYNTSQ